MSAVPPQAAGNAPLTMDHRMQLLAMATEDTYAIPCREWKFVKDRISKIATNPWLFQTIGSVLFGAGLAEFGTILTGAIPKSATTDFANSWAFTLFALVTGAITFLLARRFEKSATTSASDVVAYMSLIEERFTQGS
jgi:hypothetical protein